MDIWTNEGLAVKLTWKTIWRMGSARGRPARQRMWFKGSLPLQQQNKYVPECKPEGLYVRNLSEYLVCHPKDMIHQHQSMIYNFLLRWYIRKLNCLHCKNQTYSCNICSSITGYSHYNFIQIPFKNKHSIVWCLFIWPFKCIFFSAMKIYDDHSWFYFNPPPKINIIHSSISYHILQGLEMLKKLKRQSVEDPTLQGLSSADLV